MNRQKHIINVLVALRLLLWYIGHDDGDRDGGSEYPEREDAALSGFRSFWLTLTSDEQLWILAALERENPEEAEGIRLAILHGDVGPDAEEPD